MATGTLTRSEAEDTKKRLERWRHRLRSSDQAAYRWLKGNIPKDTAVREGDVVSASSTQALEFLARRLRKAWDREVPDLAAASRRLRAWVPHLQEQPCQPLDSDAVWRAMQEQSERAAGPDGWTGDELFSAKFAAESFASLCLAYEALGAPPAAWRGF